VTRQELWDSINKKILSTTSGIYYGANGNTWKCLRVSVGSNVKSPPKPVECQQKDKMQENMLLEIPDNEH
jgi:hypothetical protein